MSSFRGCPEVEKERGNDRDGRRLRGSPALKEVPLLHSAVLFAASP